MLPARVTRRTNVQVIIFTNTAMKVSTLDLRTTVMACDVVLALAILAFCMSPRFASVGEESRACEEYFCGDVATAEADVASCWFWELYFFGGVGDGVEVCSVDLWS